MGNKKTSRFEPSEYLDNKEAFEVYMTEAFETGDANFIAKSLGAVARAKGMSGIAETTGLSREQLYRSFGKNGNPTLKTVIAVSSALGLNLTAKVEL